LRFRTAPASFCSFAALAPRHRSGLDATRLGLFFLAALPKASAAYSGKHATRLSLCFLAALESFRDITQVWMLPAVFAFSRRQLRGIAQVKMLPSSLFAFSRLLKASATSLRSGCYPLPFLSRRRQLRGISQVCMLPLLRCGLEQNRLLCSLAAFSSAASSGQACYPCPLRPRTAPASIWSLAA
jgi:hypothetical protein